VSVDGQPLGRQDQYEPLLTWKARANITLCLLAAGAVLAWHAAVFLTADGIGAGELPRTLRALVHGRPLAGLAPADPASTAVTLTVWLVMVVLLFGVFVAWAFAWGSWRRRHAGGKGFADDDQIREGLGVDRARASAAQARPGMTAAQRKHAPVTEVGLPLGTSTSGEPAVLPLEDHVAVMATTGGGKTVSIMIPAALDAPGALVVTCTRADILDVVAARRAELGRVWVFDPLDRLGWPEPMVWNPVAGCRNGETAVSRGLAFAAAWAPTTRAAPTAASSAATRRPR